ncbi:MAG: hypothetical protein HOO96_05890 [Polyangiaceae bacterium]|nr:hypothetical protein [Polyangiaceae bacterium]
MQHARPALVLLFSLAVAAACATSTSEEPDTLPDAGTTPVVDSGTAKPDTGTTKACVPTCKTDSDCANSCPSVTSGSNCCDVGTNVCFRSASSSCPVPTTPPDASTPPPSY